MSKLWDSVQPLLDPETHLLMPPDGGRDNLVLWSAYLYRELMRTGDRDNASLVMSEIHSFCHRCEVRTGLIRRLPEAGKDNSLANITAQCFVVPGTALETLARWNAKWGCFDCDRPDWVGIGRFWFGRSPGYRAFLEASSDLIPSQWISFWWQIGTVFSIVINSRKWFTRVPSIDDLLIQSLQVDRMREKNRGMFAVRWFDRKYGPRIGEFYRDFLSWCPALADARENQAQPRTGG